MNRVIQIEISSIQSRPCVEKSWKGDSIEIFRVFQIQTCDKFIFVSLNASRDSKGDTISHQLHRIAFDQRKSCTSISFVSYSLISKFSQYRTIICTLSVSTLSRIMISNLVFKKKRTFSIEIKWFVLHERHITRKSIFYFSNSLLTRREESRTSLFSVDIRDNSREK